MVLVNTNNNLITLYYITFFCCRLLFTVALNGTTYSSTIAILVIIQTSEITQIEQPPQSILLNCTNKPTLSNGNNQQDIYFTESQCKHLVSQNTTILI